MDDRLLIALLIPALLWAFATFDQVVRWEFAEHRSAWERDGRPTGFLWRPSDVHIGSGAAAQRAMLRWVFWTPAWAAGDRVVARLIRRFRALVLVWNIGVLAVFGRQLLA
jgi:hypothetical protein